VEAHDERGMTELRIVDEPASGAGNGLDARVGEALQRALGLRCDVALVGPGALPRFELKAKRFVRRTGVTPTA
ncbi:MAG: hypothetical protein AAB284_05650, partial [Chloroflexota bacterium]